MKTYLHLIWPERPGQGPEPRVLSGEFGHMTVTPSRVFRVRDRHAERLLAAYSNDLRMATAEEVERDFPPHEQPRESGSEPQDEKPGALSLPAKRKKGGN